MILLALTACDVFVDLGDKPDPTHDSSAAIDSGDGETDRPDEDETTCDGVDDDGDGVADEGFPDSDGDGYADCVDGECGSLTTNVAGAVEADPECAETTPVADPWDVKVLWDYDPTVVPDATSAYTMPVVAQLDDDDGDGDIDAGDTPEVVVNVFNYDTPAAGVVVLDGATGAEEESTIVPHRMGGLAVADVDADGSEEIVCLDDDEHLMAMSADGTVEWAGTDSPEWAWFVHPIVADLDSDGLPEVIYYDLVVNGEDGTTAFTLECDGNDWYDTAPTTADLDGDGQMEILYAGCVFGSDGRLLWGEAAAGYSVWPAVVQADADDDAEVVFYGEDLVIYDTDGTELVRTTGNEVAGVPCAGDLDGDGEMELAAPGSAVLYAWELDGTRLWTHTVGGLAAAPGGCTTFDLDGDGRAEVLYGNGDGFTIHDGMTGEPLWNDEEDVIRPGWGSPLVADVDGDGHADILYRGWDAPYGVLRVVTHAGAGWRPAPSYWGAYDYSATNYGPLGEVPSGATPWLDPGVYRGQGTLGDADLGLSLGDTCLGDCFDGPYTFAVGVANRGALDVPNGVVLEVRAPGGAVLTSAVLPAIPAGASIDDVVFTVTPADAALGLEVGIVGAPPDCDPSDDTLTLPSPCE